ncbi:DeoR/GlpR transcriptional regulator [Lactobacillus helveticus]|nr:DeoR/GlpR transcriptional regulator [Lactobacillus helveticus]MCT0192993.1 DeoR/GlpR transcriptional regulator [Lactobacillus helveticus]
MNQEQHLLKIKELLKQRQHISTRELATYFKVSFDTARRDVIHLTSTGQAIRVHGGLMATRKSSITALLLAKTSRIGRKCFKT